MRNILNVGWLLVEGLGVMKVREIVIGDRIFLEIVVEAPERPQSEDGDPRAGSGGVRIGDLVPDAWRTA
jgi:hypothetical protein